MTSNLIKLRVSRAIQRIYVSCCKQVYIGPVKCAMNVNRHVQILLQKEELISATTIRNLQKPADFLQDLNRGW